MTESRRQKITRRSMSIPVMLGATALGLLGLPVLVPVVVVADVVRLRFKLPAVRVYLFALQYGINDSVEILLAPFLWVAAWFGFKLDSPASIRRHERLQWWSLKLLTRRAEQLLGLRIELDEASEAALISSETGLSGRPVIVLGRHVSIFDASLPAILHQSRSVPIRGVVMAELLADPGFDLIYNRLGSVFIPRDDGPAALQAVKQMTDGAEPNTAFAIFPEGRLFRRSVLERSLARLAEKDPIRGERLAGLTSVLPPRPGGFVALLEALPSADVVLIDHDGLADYPSLKALASAVPLANPVQVFVTRVARAEIPTDAAAQVEWLDELWLTLDQEIQKRSAT